MNEQSSTIESWAFQRAHQIVVHQGLSLVDAAQSLDHKRTSNHTYALRQAISDCLLEALKHGLGRPQALEEVRQ
ncbi:hypothetical protein GAO09_12930 [Rhizobiales bacterium RZME27]|uniref:Uncharacterized protein n=1 Tax=Endobacterium cereale TaxID=2663029 RepID=A0A6A8A6J3_9HYPH|nr:hypothetical protein [Endobacterium cereale]MQY46935.1 hypothetical protein [Endobacterium cereale]